MTDAQRIANLVHEHGVSTNADPTLLDWWSIVVDALGRIGFDSHSVAPILDALRPYVLVIVPTLLAGLVLRLLWRMRWRTEKTEPELVREANVPATDAPRTLTLDELLSATDMRHALGLLWRHVAHRVVVHGHGHWRSDSTPGDFYRSLEPGFAGRDAWREFTRGVEVGLYGVEAPTADVVRSWWERTASWQ
jgi:hypothetical protein